MKRNVGLPLQKGRGAFEAKEGKHRQPQRRGARKYTDFKVRQTNTAILKASVRGMCQHDDSVFPALGIIFQKEPST